MTGPTVGLDDSSQDDPEQTFDHSRLAGS